MNWPLLSLMSCSSLWQNGSCCRWLKYQWECHAEFDSELSWTPHCNLKSTNTVELNLSGHLLSGWPIIWIGLARRINFS